METWGFRNAVLEQLQASLGFVFQQFVGGYMHRVHSLHVEHANLDAAEQPQSFVRSRCLCTRQ